MVSEDYATSGQGGDTCPRCGQSAMRAWYELSEEQREVARRLPSAQDFPPDERAARHRFCPRCWHEQPIEPPRDA